MPKMRSATGKGSWLFVRGLVVFLAIGESALAQTPSPSAPEATVNSSLVVAVAVDEAGISPGDLDRTRSLVQSLLDALPRDSEMMLSRFVGEQRIVLPPTSSRPLIAEALNKLQAGSTGAVAVPDGLFDTVRALARHPASARVVLLVSAGREREGDLQFEDPLNEATAHSIAVFTLAVGQGDGKLLRRISKVTGGDSFRLEVADASLLRHAIMTRLAGAARPVSEAAAETTPEAEGARPASLGLLAVMGALALVAGLFLLGALVLFSRRQRQRQPVAPVEAEARTLVLSAADQARLSAADPAPIGSGEEDDVIVEQTLMGTPNPTLLALSGPGAGKNFPLSPTGKTSLGRSRRNDIVVPEDAASAQHCRIDREGDTYVLYDLTSTNGTWVNSVRTERVILKNGDRMKVGDTLFAVSLFSGS